MPAIRTHTFQYDPDDQPVVATDGTLLRLWCSNCGERKPVERRNGAPRAAYKKRCYHCGSLI